MSNKTRKSWQEKLAESNGLPRVDTVPPKMAKRWAIKPGSTFVIPAPREVDEIMKLVPEGKLITINEIRAALAKKHRTTTACPITTGIFAWIAANAAEEQRQEGRRDITPYWRTLKTGGELNPKYPGGVEGQKTLLEQEGHRVVRKGKKYRVVDYETHLLKLSADFCSRLKTSCPRTSRRQAGK